MMGYDTVLNEFISKGESIDIKAFGRDGQRNGMTEQHPSVGLSGGTGATLSCAASAWLGLLRMACLRFFFGFSLLRWCSALWSLTFSTSTESRCTIVL